MSSSLNIDYKILAKLIANRLKTVLPLLTNNDQTGYLNNRLSAYLFILTIKILANKIRYEKNIKGIKIDNKIIKLSMLADDLTLIL